MAGNLGASNDQSTWVLTSYLVSNAIITPHQQAGSQARSDESAFSWCVWGVFTVELRCFAEWRRVWVFFFSSECCKVWAWRGLQPMAQAILADTSFPPCATKRVGVCTLWDHGAIMAPTIGPNPGWVDNLQLFLALDFFYQSPCRHGHMVPGEALYRRSALFKRLPSRLGIEDWITWGSRFLHWASVRCRCCSTRARKRIGLAPIS